jgi:membrane-associated PAP2 superfamily phosphatase
MMQKSDMRVFTQPATIWPSSARRHPQTLASLRLWGLLLVLTLIWDGWGADLNTMGWLAGPQGFALRDHWWLSTVMHDGAKQLAVLMYLGVLVMTLWPLGIWRQLPRIQRLEIAAGMTLSLLVVTALKRISLTSCPWDLQAFGGVASYVSHWSWGVSDGGSGACFPGGHASSAFAFIALSLPWLTSMDTDQQRLGITMTRVILLTGLVLGLVQTLRGAHYPSHTAWTALVCAATAWANHGVFVWWRVKRELSAER